MTLSDLFKTLTDFINLGKVVVNTTSGTFFAVALMIALGKWPVNYCRPIQTSTQSCETDRTHKVDQNADRKTWVDPTPAACQMLEPESRLAFRSTLLPLPDFLQQRQLVEKVNALETCRTKLQALRATTDSELASCVNQGAANTLILDDAKTRFKAVSEQREAFRKGGVSLQKPNLSLTGDFEKAKQDIADKTRALIEIESQRAGTLYQQKILDGRLKIVEDWIDKLRPRLIISDSFEVILSQLFHSLLWIGLLGFALGTVLDPIQRELLLDFPDFLVETWTMRNIKHTEVQLKKKFGKNCASETVKALLEQNQAREKRMRWNLLGRRRLGNPSEPTKAPEADLDQETGTKPTRPWNYYVGKALITQDEIDVLQRRYYRFSELIMGLLATLVTVIWAFFPRVSTIAFLWVPILMGVTALAWYGVVFAARTSYRHYQTAVDQVIVGRVVAHEEAIRKTALETCKQQGEAFIKKLTDLLPKSAATASTKLKDLTRECRKAMDDLDRLLKDGKINDDALTSFNDNWQHFCKDIIAFLAESKTASE